MDTTVSNQNSESSEGQEPADRRVRHLADERDEGTCLAARAAASERLPVMAAVPVG